ncbi:Rhodanese-like domain-containing protein [Tribonema minus]|uniref:protein-tyrosine-phosphatase n=1 Tax=Tribonema minus TaxID=303371 RepID=A0A835YMT6_9STRA|nr:Rhodanese-like domain-containing protein [Tribonema minus]
MSLTFRTAKQIRPAELKTLLQQEAHNVQVVDVRDTDFSGGHIKGALNRPVDLFEDIDDVDQFIKTLASQGKQKVVFHCMLSQVRGPMCAQRFLSRAPVVAESEGTSPPEVYVLQGGFKGWAQAIAGDAELQQLTEEFVSYDYDD